MNDMTPEELEAILGTDYETVLAEALREKADAQARGHSENKIGQVGNGHVFFDPAGAVGNYMDRRGAAKDEARAQGAVDSALAAQKAGRKTYADVLTRSPAGAAPVPMATADPMAGPSPGAPPAAPPPPPAPPTMSPPAAPPAPAGLGPMPNGEPLRGHTTPGAARPPLANARTMGPEQLSAAGVPPALIAQLLRGR